MDQTKILIVDDDPDILETLEFRFKQEDYQVIVAVNGWEALGALRTQEPDIIVMDVMMPKENGYRVARIIKEDEAAGKLSKKTPIILLTARNLQDDPEREMTFITFSKSDVMLYKPFEVEQLVEMVKAMLVCQSEEKIANS